MKKIIKAANPGTEVCWIEGGVGWGETLEVQTTVKRWIVMETLD